MPYNPFNFIREELSQVKKDSDDLEKLFFVDQAISLGILIDLKLNRDINTSKTLLDYQAINLLYSNLRYDFNKLLLETPTNHPNRFNNLLHEMTVAHCNVYNNDVILIPINGLKLIESYILETRSKLYSVIKESYNLKRIYLSRNV